MIWTISIVNLFSICKIRSYVKKLSINQGIFANEKFMILYNFLFFGVAISRTVSTILMLTYESVDYCNNEHSYDAEFKYRLNIANSFFLVSSKVCFFGAHVLMLIMIIRYS